MEPSGESMIPLEKEAVYEETGHAVGPLPASFHLPLASPPRVERLFEGSDRALLIRGLLTQDECEFLMRKGEELGFSSLEGSGYKKTYRDNERVVAMGQELSAALFARLSPLVEGEVRVTEENKGGFHLGTKGTWRLSGLNECFRFCRYQPGGHFSPHYDGEFVRSGMERSFKTVMLYLNDAFGGGTTNFLTDRHELLWSQERQRYVSAPESILQRVRPEHGMAIVFDHKMLHEGDSVDSGEKYILRTEAMYSLVDRELSPLEHRFHLLIQEAQKMEAEGQLVRAVQCYKQARHLDPELAREWGL